MARHHRPYGGLLRQPIRESTWTTEDDLVVAEFERLEALLRHYDLKIGEPGAFYELAVALARRHVPGFRRVRSNDDSESPKLRGRPNKLSHLERFLLQIAVARVANSRPVTKAVYDVASRPPFSRFKPDTIRRVYYRDREETIEEVLRRLLREMRLREMRNHPRPATRKVRGAFGVYSIEETNRPTNRVRKRR